MVFLGERRTQLDFPSEEVIQRAEQLDATAKSLRSRLRDPNVQSGSSVQIQLSDADLRGFQGPYAINGPDAPFSGIAVVDSIRHLPRQDILFVPSRGTVIDPEWVPDMESENRLEVRGHAETGAKKILFRAELANQRVLSRDLQPPTGEIILARHRLEFPDRSWAGNDKLGQVVGSFLENLGELGRNVLDAKVPKGHVQGFDIAKEGVIVIVRKKSESTYQR